MVYARLRSWAFPKVRLLFSGYTYRTVDNFRDLLDTLVSRGHEVAGALFPYRVPQRNLELGDLPFPKLAFRPTELGGGDLPLSELRALVHDAVCQLRPDAVLLDDILNYPSNAIAGLVHEVAPAVPVIASQHGFFQWWGRYRTAFACDRLLVYGPRDAREFSSELSRRTVVFGLPKLSRLRGRRLEDDGSVLFVAQDTPRPQVVALALREFQQLSGRRIRIRAHPQHAAAYASMQEEGFEVLEPGSDLIEQLRTCHAVITTGSTAGMEALVLGKPVVSLPSYASYIFRDSPCLALDYSGQEIARVLREWPGRAGQLRSFLSDSVSPRSFDLDAAADKFLGLVRSLTPHHGRGRRYVHRLRESLAVAR